MSGGFLLDRHILRMSGNGPGRLSNGFFVVLQMRAGDMARVKTSSTVVGDVEHGFNSAIEQVRRRVTSERGSSDKEENGSKMGGRREANFGTHLFCFNIHAKRFIDCLWDLYLCHQQWIPLYTGQKP